MGTVKDAEYFITKISSVIQDNLNTKITAINTEKGDSLLDLVDSNAYYYLTFGQNIPAYVPAIVFGVGLELGGTVHKDATEALEVLVQMVISSKGKSSSIEVMQRIQRYRRAILKVLEENFGQLPNLTFDAAPDFGFTEANAHYYALGVVANVVYPAETF